MPATSNRDTAIALVRALCADEAFATALADLITFRTVAGQPDAPMRAYLGHLALGLAEMGYATQSCTAAGAPFLLASRIEDAARPTLLAYAHGDTAPGRPGEWAGGRDPWRLSHNRSIGHWYGRGIAASKGQTLIDMTALQAVIAVRGSLGFNHRILIEMGAEIGSPGLPEVCRRFGLDLHADLLIASTGSRIAADTPTVFLVPNAPAASRPHAQRTGSNAQAGISGIFAQTEVQARLHEQGKAQGKAQARTGGDAMVETMAPTDWSADLAGPRSDEGIPAPRAVPADDPAMRFVVQSLARTDGQQPAVLPAPGGVRPRDILAEALGLPAAWIPHAAPDCGRNRPDEHMSQALIVEAAALMAGLYWDLGAISKSVLKGA